MTREADPEQLLEELDLTEYEASALTELFSLGRTTAPDLAEASGIPKARIYGVLDSLVDRGFVKLYPGRPKKYQPKPPDEILDQAVENRRQEYEQFHQEVEEVREQFLAEFGPLYEQASEDVTPTEELFHVVDVGDPSERETRQLYHDATDTVNVLTKSFEYFDSIEPALADALECGIDVRIIFLHPDHLEPENQEVQENIIERIDREYSDIDYRYSVEKLPWRGTMADPSMDYESGTAILLVEEKDIPLSMRQAAVTENGSFVAGLARYFDLVWKHESAGPGEV